MVRTAWQWMSQDVRLALRGLRRDFLYAASVAVILGIGIGGNAAMFSIARSLLLQPLTYTQPEQLVCLSLLDPQRDGNRSGFTSLRLKQLRQEAHSLASVGAYLKVPEEMSFHAGGVAKAVRVARVTANFLDVLGVKPEQGRGFYASENEAGGASVLMISRRLWQEQNLGGMATAPVDLNGVPYTIVGVLPEGFSFPFGNVDVWVTRPAEWSAVPARFWPLLAVLEGFGRLQPGVTLSQAQGEADLLNGWFLQAYRGRLDAKPGAAMQVESLHESLVGPWRTILWILSVAVGLVLLIACANVAGLAMARAVHRRPEFAIRRALGAGSGRITAQVLLESLTLSFFGGMFGAAVAGGIIGVVRFVPRLAISGVEPIAFTFPTAGALAIVTALTGMLLAIPVLFQILGRERAENLRSRRTAGSQSVL